MLNVNQMIMKKVLSITEHKDGTFSLNHLTRLQMHAIQNALVNNWIRLKKMKEEEHDFNDVAAYNFAFSDEASDQLCDLGF